MRSAILCFLMIAGGGCATDMDTDRTQSDAWGITDRAEQGVAQLDASIRGLDERLSARRQISIGAEDDGMATLQALDLSAWELRRQQWVLQHDHLTFAKELIEKARPRQRRKTNSRSSGSHMREST